MNLAYFIYKLPTGNSLQLTQAMMEYRKEGKPDRCKDRRRRVQLLNGY